MHAEDPEFAACRECGPLSTSAQVGNHLGQAWLTIYALLPLSAGVFLLCVPSLPWSEGATRGFSVMALSLGVCLTAFMGRTVAYIWVVWWFRRRGHHAESGYAPASQGLPTGIDLNGCADPRLAAIKAGGRRLMRQVLWVLLLVPVGALMHYLGI